MLAPRSPLPPVDPASPAARALLERVLRELGIMDPPPQRNLSLPHVPLGSRLATGPLAWASVGAVTIAAQKDIDALDGSRIAIAYRSDRHLTLGGVAPTVWSGYSGFWRAADGWIRTHGNYPHHALAMQRALELPQTSAPELIAASIAEITATHAVDAITDAGGLAVHVAREQPRVDAALRTAPVLDIRRVDNPGPSPVRNTASLDAPLAGIRVLDLTRVIAGPVCTRTLALLGADVLRIDPPDLAEPEWQHLDTGHGKRSARLDAASARMRGLIEHSDVVVLGYRPSSLSRLGLSPEALVERHPGLIVAQLSAWGIEHPDRAGFDSLVQAESGIALVESTDGERPGTLPAQALDHSAGYLLAAAVTALVERRDREGGSWIARTSLRRIAAELLGMPRHLSVAAGPDPDPAPHLQRFEVGGVGLVTARPVLPGSTFAAPHSWGSDQPSW